MALALEMTCGYRLPIPYSPVLAWAFLTAFAPSPPTGLRSENAHVGEQAVLCAPSASVELSASQALVEVSISRKTWYDTWSV